MTPQPLPGRSPAQPSPGIRELFNGRGPLVIGAFCILIAIALEHAVLPARGNAEHPATGLIFALDTLILLIAEVGYAFVIAWVVSWFIERRAHTAHMQSLDDARRQIETEVAQHLQTLLDRQTQIQADVFHGAIGLAYPPSYVKTVIESALSSKIIREDYEITYRLERLSQAEASKHGVDRTRFLALHSTARFNARNVSNDTQHFQMEYGLPIRGGALRELTRLTELQFGDRKFLKAAIDDLAHYDEVRGNKSYSIDEPIPPGQAIPCVLKAVVVKELSDTEVFGFRDPTMRLTVRLNVDVPGLRFGASPRCASPMQTINAPDGRTGEWRIEGALLPRNSFTIWWRSPADDGEKGPLEPQPSANVHLPDATAGITAGKKTSAAAPRKRGTSK